MTLKERVFQKVDAMIEEAKKTPPNSRPEVFCNGPCYLDGIKTKEQAEIFKILTYAAIGKCYLPGKGVIEID